MTAARAPMSLSRTGGFMWRPTLLLSLRSVKALARQPQVVMPSIIFPLFFAAMNSASFARATEASNWPYPGTDFLTFQLAATVLQGVLFGSTQSGSEMAKDIEIGFFDRLVSAPASRVSILAGRLAGGALLGMAQALLFTVVLVMFGAELRAGLAGVVVLVAMGALLAAGIGGLGMVMALRTGSSEAVQGSFPLLFVLMFMSSAFFPRELMEGWFKGFASINPISHIVEGMRHLVAVGWDWSEAFSTLGIGMAFVIVSVALSARALRIRVEGP